MSNMLRQVTTIEQSKKLLEIGIDVNSASMCYINHYNDSSIVPTLHIKDECFDMEDKDILPCWTIFDMLEIINKYRAFAISLMGQVEIYYMDEPCKEVIGKEFTIRDDFSILRNNIFDALIWLKKELDYYVNRKKKK